jgi:GNAT superfamily N-acetyltransferase
MVIMVIFKQATKEDAQNLKDIAKRVIYTSYTPFLGLNATNSFIESGQSDKEIDDGLFNCTLAIYNEVIIGFVIVNREVLHLMMIDVPFQNTGYGSALLRHTEERLFSDHDCLRLQTFQANSVAIGFYLKNGWQITGQEEIAELGAFMLYFEKRRDDTSVNYHRS